MFSLLTNIGIFLASMFCVLVTLCLIVLFCDLIHELRHRKENAWNQTMWEQDNALLDAAIAEFRGREIDRMKTILGKAWGQRNKLFKEYDRLKVEEDKAGQNNLWAEEYRLLSERNKLWAEADLIYINAVIDIFGKSAKIDWSTGEITCDERSEIPFSEIT